MQQNSKTAFLRFCVLNMNSPAGPICKKSQGGGKQAFFELDNIK
jgi:hypothetical protein